MAKTRKAQFLYPTSTIELLKGYLHEFYEKGYLDGRDGEWNIYEEVEGFVDDLSEKICNLFAKTQIPIKVNFEEQEQFIPNKIKETLVESWKDAIIITDKTEEKK